MAKTPLGRLDPRAFGMLELPGSTLRPERAAEVLAVAQRLTKREDDRLAKLDSGMPLKDWIKL